MGVEVSSEVLSVVHLQKPNSRQRMLGLAQRHGGPFWLLNLHSSTPARHSLCARLPCPTLSPFHNPRCHPFACDLDPNPPYVRNIATSRYRHLFPTLFSCTLPTPTTSLGSRRDPGPCDLTSTKPLRLPACELSPIRAFDRSLGYMPCTLQTLCTVGRNIHSSLGGVLDLRHPVLLP